MVKSPKYAQMNNKCATKNHALLPLIFEHLSKICKMFQKVYINKMSNAKKHEFQEITINQHKI